MESLPTLDSVIRSANRANVSIYAVDPQESIAEDAGNFRFLGFGDDGGLEH